MTSPAARQGTHHRRRFSGMAAAIELRRQGIEVDVVEIDPGWRSYGAGISLGGATLRAFRRLGILDAFLEQGAASDGVEICIPTGEGRQLPTPRIAGPDVPGNGGIMRPVLARILADATRASGARRAPGLHLHVGRAGRRGRRRGFSDGVRGRYDLVIGADGLYSKVRETLFPDAPKPPTAARACGARCCRVREERERHHDVAGPEGQDRPEPGLARPDVPVRDRGPPGQRLHRPVELPAHAQGNCWRASRRR
jgi:2-polyprenyl-6-methoxyphenol hydroxylase-like FAD-dependent oxidoreductase